MAQLLSVTNLVYETGLPLAATKWIEAQQRVLFVVDNEPHNKLRQIYVWFVLNDLVDIKISWSNQEDPYFPSTIGAWNGTFAVADGGNLDIPLWIGYYLAKTRYHKTLVSTNDSLNMDKFLTDMQLEEYEMLVDQATIVFNKDKLTDGEWNQLQTECFLADPLFLIVTRVLQYACRITRPNVHVYCSCAGHYSCGEWSFPCLKM